MIYLAIALCGISAYLCVRCLWVRRQRKAPEWKKTLTISFFFGAIGLLWLPFWLGMTALQWSRDGEKALLLLLFLPLLWPVQLGYLNWWLRYDDAGFTWHGPLLGKARSYRYEEVTEIRRGSWQTAKGAIRILNGLGAEVDVFPRKQEKLFLKKKFDYDVIVNCVMWDISRTDRLIYREDLKKMRPHTMIIDVSCDPHLEIETSHPTTISDPVYEVDGVIHYTVDNTPAMFPYTVTKVLSDGNVRMMDDVIEGTYPPALLEAMVIDKGHIRSKSVWDFREARGLEVR